MSQILITGGTGYIGSHTCVELIKAGFSVVIVDNLSNSDQKTLQRIKRITGVEPEFHCLDLRDRGEFNEILTNMRLDGFIHFAASKAVGESVKDPLKYYDNNIACTITVLAAMERHQISNLVFSSSSTVYGKPDKLPVDEQTPVKPAESPYGNTKRICEEIIRDFFTTRPDLRGISLRYFNPVGAHDSGYLGELPIGIPGNLIPFVTQTAVGIRRELNVFGGDYNTPDGTAIRDYVHVVDLAKAHVSAMNRMLGNKGRNNYETFNVDTGRGYSVMEVIKCFENTNRIKVPYKIVNRRPGDVESVYADTSLANQELQWKAEHNLDDMMRTAWKWQLTLSEEHVKVG